MRNLIETAPTKTAIRTEGVQPKKRGLIQLHQDAKNILHQSLSYLIVGPPGSGKSNFIQVLLASQQLLYLKFQRILLVSPYVSFGQVDFDPKWVINSLQPRQISQKLLQIQNQCRDKQKPWRILIIIDDMVTGLSTSKKGSAIIDLYLNRRNIVKNAQISIITTTQKYKLLPSAIRNTANAIFIFGPTQSQLCSINLQVGIGNKQFRQLLIKKSRQPYSFIMIDVARSKVRVNWQQL